MHQVELSDQLFAEAARKAAATGVSVQRFVAEAVRLHLDDASDEPQTLGLTAEQAAMVRKGQADAQAGRVLTLEQLDERSANMRAAWLRDNPS